MKRIHLAMLAVILAVATAGMAASNDVMAQTDDSVPSIQGVSYSLVSDGPALVSWTPGVNPAYVGQIVLGKEYGETAWTMESSVVSPTTTQARIESVVLGKTYVFTVAGLTSTDPRVYGGYSYELTVTIPSAESLQSAPEPEPTPEPVAAPPPSGDLNPSEPRFSYAGGDTVHFSWTPGTNPAYVGQIVLGKEYGETAWTMESSVVSPTMDVATISPVVPGNTYVFKVAGLSSVEPRVYEGYSEEVTLIIMALEQIQSAPEPAPEPSPEPAPTPSPPAERNPSALSATSSDGSVTLTWVPGTNPKFAKQAIKRREAKRGSKWVTIELDVAATTYTDTSVQVGKRYIYRVQGLKSNNKVAGVSRAAKITVR